MKTGEVDSQMSVGDICKRLRLQGDGIGQPVAARSHEVLAGIGMAYTSSKIVVCSWNPPEVTIAIEGTIYKDVAAPTQHTKLHTVAVDDLVSVETKAEHPKKKTTHLY